MLPMSSSFSQKSPILAPNNSLALFFGLQLSVVGKPSLHSLVQDQMQEVCNDLLPGTLFQKTPSIFLDDFPSSNVDSIFDTAPYDVSSRIR